MIKSIEFENYKAFKEGKVEIRPITVLLGANSVGKSSIIQLLLMLQQTQIASINAYKSALKLYGGGFLNLGEIENIFKNKVVTENLIIKIEISSKKLHNLFKYEIIQGIFSSIIENCISYMNFFVSPSDIEGKNIGKFILLGENYNYRHQSEIKFDFTPDEFEHFLETVKTLPKRNEIRIRGNSKDNILRIADNVKTQFNDIFNKGNLNQIISSYKYLYHLSKEIASDSFSVEYELSIKSEKLKIDSIKIFNAENMIFSIKENASKDSFVLQSDIFKLIKPDKLSIRGIKSEFDFSSTVFTILKNRPFYRMYPNPSRRQLSFNTNPKKISIELIKAIFYFFNNEVASNFDEDKINYVSPLRAHPKRYYFLDKAKFNISLDTLDGDALAEILKENSKVKSLVNKWLENFDLKVEVEEFKEILHKLKIKQNNLLLDITDVGFGISQILPVIIQGFLAKGNSLTIIEQPEIHLHPTMQADLADLFIDIVKNPTEAISNPNREGLKKYLLIETHSEYFLKRLRRRISEGTIDNEDVAIYLVSPDIDGSKIERLKIEERGAFKFPKNFYSGELLKDTTEFIKHQA